ncbi:MAG TPA: polysaccharide deacetylase family protein, partial [Polyangiaceae bacterium]|nr:polysaccharide deacetylase family protein [Polyangiaceae bacterium]
MLTFDCGEPQGRPLILMFHRVVPRHELRTRLVARPRFEMSSERFADVLRELPRMGYSVVSLDELAARLADGRPTRQLAAITFDDGFSDVVLHALPLLEQYRAPFTLYVTTGYPERRLMHISAAIEEQVVKQDGVLELELLGSRVRLPVRSAAEKVAALQHLEGLAFSRFASIADAARAFGFDPLAHASTVLGWEELAMLARHPLCTLGAHTANHPDLTSRPRDEVRRELSESNALLSAVLGRAPVHFAYPFGKYDATAREEGFRAGYRVIVKTGRA